MAKIDLEGASSGRPCHTITIAAALVLDGLGRMLLVRKAGTQAFMQPGGKIETGEAAATCLVRELWEEIGLDLTEKQLEPLGLFKAEAANEANTIVSAHVFQVSGTIDPGAIGPKAEIDELVWLRPDADDPAGIALAPLTHDQILPLVRGRVETRPNQ